MGIYLGKTQREGRGYTDLRLRPSLGAGRHLRPRNASQEVVREALETAAKGKRIEGRK